MMALKKYKISNDASNDFGADVNNLHGESFKKINNLKLAQMKARKNGLLISKALNELGLNASPEDVIAYICKATKVKLKDIKVELMSSIESAVTLGFLTMSEHRHKQINFDNFANAHQHHIYVFKALQCIGAPARAEDVMEFISKRTQSSRLVIAQKVLFTLNCALYFGFLIYANNRYHVNYDELRNYCPEIIVSMRKRGGMLINTPKSEKSENLNKEIDFNVREVRRVVTFDDQPTVEYLPKFNGFLSQEAKAYWLRSD